MKSSKNILNCCNIQVVFKSTSRLGNSFHFKDQIPKDLTFGVAYKFQCGLCSDPYYGECVRNFNEKLVKHIGILPLTKKQVSLRKALQPIIQCFATIQFHMINLVF